MPNIQVPKKLAPLFKKKKRFKIVIGGRGSGKSMTVADLCLVDVQSKGIKVGCFREFQNSISDSVLSLLSDEIDRVGFDGFEVQNNCIKYKGVEAFTFKGLARNPESIKSMSGYSRFFVEEAQTISRNSLKILTPTLRSNDSEIWMVGNPRSSADPFSQRFIIPYQKELDKNGYYEDDLHLIIVCNYIDNRFFPKVLEKERLHDFETLSRAEYDHIWLGKFNDTISNSIIKPEWFDAAIDAHEKLGIIPKGAVVVAHDPSDEGEDAKGVCVRKGILVEYIDAKDDGDVNEGCDWATDLAIKYNADLFAWDCDGLGISLKRQIAEAFAGKKIDMRVFKGSHAADNPDQVYEPVDSIAKSKTNRETFKNKRSQYYWKLRERFYNTYQAVQKGKYVDPDTIISIKSSNNIQALKSEVCRIPIKPNGNGLIQIMSKQDMLSKHQIHSPNMADALMMSMESPIVSDEFAPIHYQKMSIV
jgi:phage terminase large subunit